MALIKHVLLVWFACYLYSSYTCVVEGIGALSQEEDIGLEKQLKFLNKPAVKTIQTEYGDIYDCIDFYKQPAFDHPLLKNHTFHFQMRPFSVPKMSKRGKNFTNNTKTFHIGLKGGCPYGTVPIRRTTKDDLIRAKLHTDMYRFKSVSSDVNGSKNASKFSVLTSESPGTHYAVVQTKFDPEKKYNGGGAYISIYNPSVINLQYSSGRISIQNGPDIIQVGWTVNPTLYGDNSVRLYTHLKTSESQCFNTQCPGFVIVNTDIPLDAFLPASKRGVLPSYALVVLIYRDPPNGNWWLEVGEDHRQIGFWPQQIFTGLSDLALNVEWGGEVSGPTDIPSPPMCSGDLVEEDTRYDAFCMDITTINNLHEVVDAENTEEYRDNYNYQVTDYGIVKARLFRHLVLFGGPGGIIGN